MAFPQLVTDRMLPVLLGHHGVSVRYEFEGVLSNPFIAVKVAPDVVQNDVDEASFTRISTDWVIPTLTLQTLGITIKRYGYLLYGSERYEITLDGEGRAFRPWGSTGAAVRVGTVLVNNE